MADTSVARDQLRSIVERVERLEEEKKAIGDDIRDVYAEAKANGFDTKALRAVVKLRKMEAAERMENEAILDLYMSALGMLPDSEVRPLETPDKPEKPKKKKKKDAAELYDQLTSPDEDEDEDEDDDGLDDLI
jgi:uncharacterized protein (UPF0335 family)